MMTTRTLDLSCGNVKILGNEGDSHTLRLTNPTGEVVIQDRALFNSSFEDSFGRVSLVVLDVSQISDGVLLIPIVIMNGTLRVHLLDPQQTLLTAEIEVK